MLTTLKKPYLGVAYYPEDWDESEVDRDVVRLKSCGINVVRIAEFAWHRMELHPGEFDFSFFHRVVDKMHAAGIGVVLGTPTATPPRWLIRLYPDVVIEHASGRTAQHGGRRHCCSNNAHYNEYSLRIVEKMAQEFADDPGVIGWQIDNEIYAFNQGCFCPDCQAKFRERMREKFGTIDALNEAWNLNLFSQWYDDFADIPAPRDAWHNPHLRMEWDIFQNESHAAFVIRQAEVMKKYIHVPIGTDIMPVNGMDYRKLNEHLDVIQFNHYNVPDNLHHEAFWFDYIRTLKDRPFWNTETATCWNGSAEITQSLKPDGFCRANSWMPVALGGEANMYWLWRTHWAGHELVHGAVLDSSGREMLATGEVREVSEGFDRASGFVEGTKVKTDVAMHFSSLIWNMHASQPVVEGWKYAETLQNAFYRPMTDLGLRPDVIDAAEALDKYRLIFTPMMMTLEEADLGSRMAQWVKNGGTWVVGPLTDVRSIHGTRYRDRYYGILEELTGVKWMYGVPDREGRVSAAWADGEKFEGNTWFEISELCGEDALVSVIGGHKAIEGKSLVICRKAGKGCVILLGTVPSAADMQRIVKIACAESGVRAPEVDGSVMVSPRSGEAGEGVIFVEYANQPASVKLDSPMVNLLTGETVQGKVEIEPYGVLVLKNA